MDIDRLVYIIAATFGLDYRICTPTRDIEAEDALTRALARNGGDGLTACHEDASACPKPCLRHRRVNVGIWPNWRCNWSSLEFSRWHDCPLALPGTTIGGYLDARNCGTYQDHLAHEELKRKTAAYIQNRRNQEWDYDPHATPPIFWSNGPSGEDGGLVSLFNLQAEDLLRQARNISDNMGISPMWDREPSRPSWAQNGEERAWWDRNLGSLRSSSPPNTTWHAQYPEQVWNERSEPQWTVSSPAPRPLEGRTYRFDPVSFTVPPPAESPQPSASLAPPLPASSFL